MDDGHEVLYSMFKSSKSILELYVRANENNFYLQLVEKHGKNKGFSLNMKGNKKDVILCFSLDDLSAICDVLYSKILAEKTFDNILARHAMYFITK